LSGFIGAMKMIVLALFLPPFVVFGSDTNSPLIGPTIQHVITVPTNFIRQVTSADHVFVRPRSNYPPFASLNLNLTGKKAHDVVRAISLLKNDDIVGEYRPSCGCEDMKLQFYRGTNFLGEAFFVDEVVAIDDEYKDRTGTLQQLHNALEKKMDKAIEEWSKQSRKTND
jgi:hypothetical protein